MASSVGPSLTSVTNFKWSIYHYYYDKRCVFSGFIKFLGPYYMLLITERDQIGDIFGHVVYKPAKTKKFVVPSTSYNFSDTKNEE